MALDNSTPAYTYQCIPEELKRINHWILWKKVWKPEKKKYDKVPTKVDGYAASINNPSHFSTFTDATFAFQMGIADGIGFCFTGDEGLIFLDIDGAIKDGQWVNGHLHTMQAFPTWGELSQSGEGVHLIAKGSLDRTRVNHDHGLELYSGNRFCAMTGWQLQGWPDTIENCQPGIDQLKDYLDSLRAAGDGLTIEYSDMPEISDPVDIRNLKVSSPIYNFLTTGAADKWDGDRSRAMLASSMSLYACGLSDGEVLSTMWHWCGHIAQQHRPVGDACEWLWKYCVARAVSAKPAEAEDLFSKQETVTSHPVTTVNRLDRLLDEIPDLEMGSVADTATIAKAKQLLSEAMNLDAGSKIAVRDAVRRAMTWTKTEINEVMKELERDARTQRLQHNDIADVLDDYLYVANIHSFMHKQSGQILKPEAFVALHTHLTHDVRDIVLSGEGCAKVTGIDFDPSQPEFFTRDGGTFFNTWQGLASVGSAGDFTPWWNHLCTLVPVERERDHLLDWMAYTLQHPEDKINHCIILAGHPGIGKDTLFWPLNQALGRHAKQVDASALLRDFNDFYREAKLVTVQEVDMGSRRDASMVANKMKPVLATPPDTLYINAKGITPFPIQNVVHSVLFTNESHPMLVKDGDRRYFVLTSELRVHDLSGEQMPEWRDYFNALWSWMKGYGGWQHVVHYLLSRDVSSFNPKAAPPMTEGKVELIEEGRSVLETVIKDMTDTRVGPFEYDIVDTESVARFLSTEGLWYLITYNIKDAPSPVALGRVMKSLGFGLKRVRISGRHKRLWVARNVTKWSYADNSEVQAYVNANPYTT